MKNISKKLDQQYRLLSIALFALIFSLITFAIYGYALYKTYDQDNKTITIENTK